MNEKDAYALIREHLEKNDLKSIPFFLRKNKDIKDIVEEKTKVLLSLFQTSAAEKLYLFMKIMEGESVNPVCKYNNKKVFISYAKGYRKYCGLTRDCKCAKECISAKISEQKLNYDDEKRNRIEDKKRETNKKRYGVENTLQTEKARENFRKLYSDRNKVMEIIRKTKENFLRKHGVDSPMKLEEVKNKQKQTNLIRFGVENPMKLEIIKNKARNTLYERYDVFYPGQIREGKEKRKQTCLQIYGHDHHMKNEKIKEKTRETVQQRYGVDHVLKSKEIKEKSIKTMIMRYGVPHAVLSEEILEKIIQTNMRRYDVPWTCMSEEVKRKKENTLLINYGVTCPFKIEEIKEKAKRTLQERYNVDHISYIHLSKETVEKINDPDWIYYQHHVLKKTGIQISKEIGVSETVICKKMNKFGIPILTHTRSYQERLLEDFIKSLGFEVKNSVRGIITPYELDIYIPEKNVAIEFCGLFWHSEKGGGKGRDYHAKKLELCEKKGVKLITIFSNEWTNERRRVERNLHYILTGDEESLFEEDIGKEEIHVSRRWSDGKVLEKFGYKLDKILEPKSWFIGKGYFDLVDSENESIDLIWDCGWYIYKKIH